MPNDPAAARPGDPRNGPGLEHLGQARCGGPAGSRASCFQAGSVIDDRIETACSAQSVDSVEGDADGLRVRGRHECSGRPVGYTLVLRAASDNAVSFELRIDELAFNRTYLTYASDAGEHFFGFGEQFTHFDLKGRKVPIFVMEQGVGRGLQPLTAIVNLVAGSGGNWHTTYTPVPHYVTSRLRSLALDNSEYSSFDLRKANRVTVEAFAPVMAGRIYSGGTPLDLIAGHTREAGRMRALPEWVHSGAIIGMQGGTARVRVMTYVNPFLVDVEDKPNHR